ncbi:MAG TPA: peptide chain release factor N(5)-glutamine methyltransferase [Edaphobacter sp.]|jgi:release factor glutamine methyltransferase
MTLQQAIQSATELFAADEDLRESARRDAESLIMHTVGLSQAGLLANPARELSAEELGRYRELIARRVAHEPMQYITGTQEFYGFPFRVTPAVLIPRPETEHLVEAVLERMPHDRVAHIVDIGTGSGAIALALALHLPKADVFAVDLSPAALAIAQENATALKASDRIRFVLSDLLDALPAQQKVEYFDAVVSNPPYVPSSDAAQMHPQVRDYEPASALFAGGDGFDVYRRLIPQAKQALRSGGLLALEIGFGQRSAIEELLAGWQEIAFVDDLQGIPRVALARK